MFEKKYHFFTGTDSVWVGFFSLGIKFTREVWNDNETQHHFIFWALWENWSGAINIRTITCHPILDDLSSKNHIRGRYYPYFNSNVLCILFLSLSRARTLCELYAVQLTKAKARLVHNSSYVLGEYEKRFMQRERIFFGL